MYFQQEHTQVFIHTAVNMTCSDLLTGQSTCMTSCVMYEEQPCTQGRASPHTTSLCVSRGQVVVIGRPVALLRISQQKQDFRRIVIKEMEYWSVSNILILRLSSFKHYHVFLITCSFFMFMCAVVYLLATHVVSFQMGSCVMIMTFVIRSCCHIQLYDHAISDQYQKGQVYNPFKMPSIISLLLRCHQYILQNTNKEFHEQFSKIFVFCHKSRFS